jgi:hypothetical protein
MRSYSLALGNTVETSAQAVVSSSLARAERRRRVVQSSGSTQGLRSAYSGSAFLVVAKRWTCCGRTVLRTMKVAVGRSRSLDHRDQEREEVGERNEQQHTEGDCQPPHPPRQGRSENCRSRPEHHHPEGAVPRDPAVAVEHVERARSITRHALINRIREREVNQRGREQHRRLDHVPRSADSARGSPLAHRGRRRMPHSLTASQPSSRRRTTDLDKDRSRCRRRRRAPTSHCHRKGTAEDAWSS